MIEAGDHRVLELGDPRRPHVGRAAGQREVGEQARAIEGVGAQIAREPVIQDVRLERVEHVRQRRHLGPQGIEVGDARDQVVLPVDVVRRAQADQAGLDPRAVLAEPRHPGRQVVELGAGEPVVDGERAEALRRLLAEVGGDGADQPGQAGAADPAEAFEQLAPAGGVERARQQVRQGGVGDRAEPARALQRLIEQPGRIEQDRRQPALIARGLGLELGLVIVADAEVIGEPLGVGREVGVGAQQELAALDHAAPRRVAVLGTPTIEDRIDLGQLALVLQANGPPVVVILGTSHERGEGRVTIVGKRQRFELLDVHRARAYRKSLSAVRPAAA